MLGLFKYSLLLSSYSQSSGSSLLAEGLLDDKRRFRKEQRYAGLAFADRVQAEHQLQLRLQRTVTNVKCAHQKFGNQLVASKGQIGGSDRVTFEMPKNV